MELKPGVRLRSSVCTAEFAVVKAPAEQIDLRCGGKPMTDVSAPASAAGTPEPGFDGGSLVGKRYVDESGTLEVLCTKAGPSSLSVGEDPLVVKDAKPLPSSD